MKLQPALLQGTVNWTLVDTTHIIVILDLQISVDSFLAEQEKAPPSNWHEGARWALGEGLF